MTVTDYAGAALLLQVVLLLALCRESPADREWRRLQRWRWPARKHTENPND